MYLGFEYYANYEDFAISSNMQPLLGYTNWLTDEDPTARQACVKMSVSDNYTWVDVDCGTSLQYVCEGRYPITRKLAIPFREYYRVVRKNGSFKLLVISPLINFHK